MYSASDLPWKLKVQIWERDEFRCRECGVGVGGRGCMPQTHHIVPRAAGGTDDVENLITLCFPCHTMRASPGHRELLLRMPPERLTDFVKHWTWDLGTNLLGYAEWMNPRHFPVDEILRGLKMWRAYLDQIIEFAEYVKQDNTKHVVSHGEFHGVGGATRGVDGVLCGVRHSWFSDFTQQFLDSAIVEARRAWRSRLADQLNHGQHRKD